MLQYIEIHLMLLFKLGLEFDCGPFFPVGFQTDLHSRTWLFYLDAPKLSELKLEQVDSFVCRSVPVATKARENHNNELRLLKQPWWRKLSDEYQDSVYEDTQIL